MRLMFAVLGSALIAATSPASVSRTPEAQAKLDKWLGGRIAGKAKRCLPVYHTSDPIGIDDNTILFRDGPRVWRSELSESFECGKVNKQAIVTSASVANRLCSGDKINFSVGGLSGACRLGEFVPYTKR